MHLSWVPPADTGQGNGAPSQAEPLLYEVWAVQCNISEPPSSCAAAGGGPMLLGATADALANATVAAGLTSARRYVLYLRAVNRAGGGGFANATQVTLDLPSAPQNLTATVSPAYGPLRVALSWATPANTGQGLGNQSEPILGYRLYVGDDAGALNGSRGRLLSEGLDRTFLASFLAARREHLAGARRCTSSGFRFTAPILRSRGPGAGALGVWRGRDGGDCGGGPRA